DTTAPAPAPVPPSAGGVDAPARSDRLQASANRPASRHTTVASVALILKIVRVNLLRRHPIALGFIVLILLAATSPLPPVVDAATGTPPLDADLVRPTAYTALAPISHMLDTLTFLTVGRAIALLIVWIPALALRGWLRPGSRRRRVVTAVLGAAVVPGLGGGAVLLPR